MVLRNLTLLKSPHDGLYKSKLKTIIILLQIFAWSQNLESIICLVVGGALYAYGRRLDFSNGGRNHVGGGSRGRSLLYKIN